MSKLTEKKIAVCIFFKEEDKKCSMRKGPVSRKLCKLKRSQKWMKIGQNLQRNSQNLSYTDTCTDFTCFNPYSIACRCPFQRPRRERLALKSTPPHSPPPHPLPCTHEHFADPGCSGFLCILEAKADCTSMPDREVWRLCCCQHKRWNAALNLEMIWVTEHLPKHLGLSNLSSYRFFGNHNPQ